MTKWLRRLVAAYRPIYLRGLLLDGPCQSRVAPIRASVADDPATPATSPHIEIDATLFPAIKLERTA